MQQTTLVSWLLLFGLAGGLAADDRKAIIWYQIAQIPGAASLHQGASPPRGDERGWRANESDLLPALDVLTTDGKVMRLTKDRHRMVFTQQVAYDGGDVAEYTGGPDGGLILTRDGNILVEREGSWSEIGHVPDARHVTRCGSIHLVQVGEREILRIPGAGQTESFYTSSTDIHHFAGSPAGAFITASGGLYFVARPGESHLIVQGDPKEWEKILFDESATGASGRIRGKFEEIGVAGDDLPGYMTGWLYLLKRSAEVSFVSWDGVEYPLLENVERFTGYDSGDHQNYSYIDRRGGISRTSFKGREVSAMREPDPDLIDYRSFSSLHYALQKSGRILVSYERPDNAVRPAPGASPLPFAQVATELATPPWDLSARIRRDGQGPPAWRLLFEDIARDDRPELEAARRILPEILSVYDPEKAKYLDNFDRYIEVHDRIHEALAPLRAARNDPSLDHLEDLRQAESMLDEKFIPHEKLEEYRALVDRIVDRMVAEIQDQTSPGAQSLARGLGRYQLKRRIGFVDWRLGAIVKQLEEDRRNGLWN